MYSSEDVAAINRGFHGSLNDPTLAITFIDAPKSCCASSAATMTLMAEGLQRSCEQCGNVMRTKIVESPPSLDLKSAPKKGYGVQSVTFLPGRWPNSEAHKSWLEDRELKQFVGFPSRVGDVYMTSPANWFEEESPWHAYRVDDGVFAIFGRLKASKIADGPTVSEIRESLDSESLSWQGRR